MACRQRKVRRRPARPPRAQQHPGQQTTTCAAWRFLDVKRQASWRAARGNGGSDLAQAANSCSACLIVLNEAIATSSMEASGSRVVKDCSARLGWISHRTTGLLQVIGGPADVFQGNAGQDRDQQDAADQSPEERQGAKGANTERKAARASGEMPFRSADAPASNRATTSGVSSAPASYALMVLCSAP